MTIKKYNQDEELYGPVPVTKSRMHEFAQKYFKMRKKVHAMDDWESPEFKKGRKKYKQEHSAWQTSQELLKDK